MSTKLKDMSSSVASSSSNEEEETPSKIYCIYMSLARQGSDFSCLLRKINKDKSTSPLDKEGTLGGPRRVPEADPKMSWNACVLWSTAALKEFELHREMEYKLHTDLNLGRLLSTSLNQEGTQNWPALGKMDWKKSFMLVDVISGDIGICGASKFIRVEETLSYGNYNKEKIVWDLVVPEDCKVLLEEMARRWRHGVKTTVMLWQVFQQPYSKVWKDGVNEVNGELHFRPGRRGSKPSALIFHQERIGDRRRRQLRNVNKGQSGFRGLEGTEGVKRLFWEGMNGDLVMLYVVKYYKEEEEEEERVKVQRKVEVDEGEETEVVEAVEMGPPSPKKMPMSRRERDLLLRRGEGEGKVVMTPYLDDL